MKDRNAGIWYASDGYDPAANGVNGRRVAGASFLKGFFRHAEVSEFVSVTRGSKGAAAFAELKKDAALPQVAHRAVFEQRLDQLHPLGVLYFPAPNYADQLWRRQACGAQNHAICGITHTTATQAVMQGFFDLRAGPQMEWDGIICTSRAVHAAVTHNLDIADDMLHDRFGYVPPRPQMPVIPLGITCDDYAHDPKAAARLRKRMGWTDRDVAVVTLSRLLPYGKFDPGPLFVALQRAQKALGKTVQLNFLACGIYADTHSEKVFNDCAHALMPDVPFHHLPGDHARARAETLSGGDIFTFPIDNVQETFGLAPIEAMAAGLPVVVSDWDGMRDTVTEDVGLRVPTRMARSEATKTEGEGYLSGALSYAQYGNALSMMTEIDIGQLTEAFVVLARDPNMRRRMGTAGKARAKAVYDWRTVIPQMQDFWAELDAIRRASLAVETKVNCANPVGPVPSDLFASYPVAHLDPIRTQVVLTASPKRLEQIYSARRYNTLGRPAERLETLQLVAEGLARQTDGATCKALVENLWMNPLTIERSVMFLLKYGLARTL